MNKLLSAVDHVPVGIVAIFCATLGLAPFSPPHIIEKLSMLLGGTLIKPVDWFDLLLHGTPWLLLILKLIAWVVKPSGNPGRKD